MHFANKWFFLLFLVLIPMIWLYFIRDKKKPAIKISDLSILKKVIQPKVIIYLRHFPFFLRTLGISLLIIALARPQKGTSEEEITAQGIDIMITLDISVSMKALDFQPKNRLFVAKETTKEFIKNRRSDRIGLVVFAKRAYTKCPLTLDLNILSGFIDKTDFEEFSDATAIGTAIATAANRLKESSAKSKVIILLTDGANNYGELAPITAAKAAGELGIKIYTIGVGKQGNVPYPVEVINPFTGQKSVQIQNIQSDLDEQLLLDIASTTQGKFFRAHNTEELKEIYSIIDKMEKTEIKSKIYTSYSDRFFPWLFWGCILIILEYFLSHTILRRLP
jgi:Ca-activated chloride channel family protein